MSCQKRSELSVIHEDPLRTSDKSENGAEKVQDKSVPEVVCTPSKRFPPKQRNEGLVVYASINDQLAAIGRRISKVQPDGNCLFESIARQMGDTMNHRVLRALACHEGMEHPELFEEFLVRVGSDEYYHQLGYLHQDKEWDIDIGDLAIAMVQSATRRRIAILRDWEKPTIIPDDGQEIDDDTIVIVQDDMQTHYDATKLLYGCSDERLYGTAAQQVAIYGRVIDPVSVGEDSLLEAVRRQLKHRASPSLGRLRRMVSNFENLHRHRFLPLSQLRILQEYGRLEIVADKEWKPSYERLALEIIADIFFVKIVIVERFHAPRYFPKGHRQMDKNTVVLVKDYNFDSHYDATKKKLAYDNLVGYGTVEQQLAKHQRVIVQAPHDADSLFFCLASELEPMTKKEIQEEVKEVAFARAKEKLPEEYSEGVFNYLHMISLSKIQYGDWNPKMRDLVLHICSDLLNEKIVLVHDQSRPQHFPNDDKPVDEDTIVIVQEPSEYFGSRFHGSRLSRHIRVDNFIAAESQVRDSTTDVSSQRCFAVECIQNLITTLCKILAQFKRTKTVPTDADLQPECIEMAEMEPGELTKPKPAPRSNKKYHVTPETEYHVTPEREYHMTPETEYLVTAERAYLATPETEYLETPEREYLVTPETEYHVTPERGYHVTPERGYHVTPERGYHVTPERGYHVTPERGYHVTPEREVNEQRPHPLTRYPTTSPTVDEFNSDSSF